MFGTPEVLAIMSGYDSILPWPLAICRDLWAVLNPLIVFFILWRSLSSAEPLPIVLLALVLMMLSYDVYLAYWGLPDWLTERTLIKCWIVMATLALLASPFLVYWEARKRSLSD